MARVYCSRWHGTVVMSRTWAMPNPETFKIPPVRDLLVRYIRRNDAVVDPCSGNAKWGTCTNDRNPMTSADHHLDAVDFLKTLPSRVFHVALFDPPYSARQVKECYEGFGLNVTQQDTQSSVYSRVKAELDRVLRPDGIAISFGWNSAGMGRGWDRTGDARPAG